MLLGMPEYQPVIFWGPDRNLMAMVNLRGTSLSLDSLDAPLLFDGASSVVSKTMFLQGNWPNMKQNLHLFHSPRPQVSGDAFLGGMLGGPQRAAAEPTAAPGGDEVSSQMPWCQKCKGQRGTL